MKKFNKSKISGIVTLALTVVLALPTMASAHCDTMDGPTIKDHRRLLRQKMLIIN